MLQVMNNCHEPAEDNIVRVSIVLIYCYFVVYELWFLSDCISVGFFIHFGQKCFRFLLINILFGFLTVMVTSCAHVFCSQSLLSFPSNIGLVQVYAN